MSTHIEHRENQSFYFITFTCYKWLRLFQETSIYDYLHFWFDKLKVEKCFLSGYVIMPNHMHLVIYQDENKKSLNKVIVESKRFLVYEIVKRLKKKDRYSSVARRWSAAKTKGEKARGIKCFVYPLMQEE